ncbi:MAG: hypothetical protein OEU68_07275 [Nitrospira sp.]|nr:hypothetical protein [Nitrospira sp.]MDH4245043.1 hypothetical protein [Nitrospira sp.]MDH4355952.1 hypothetical protein [Nitrospira sp.]MDH5319375.1 hypothetical protein [Nitrospira sp.]
MNIINAIEDPHLFRPLFKDLATWRNWMTVLKGIFALEMTEEERTTFTTLTGRQSQPTQPVQEAWLICGRRGGKSFIVALIAVFLACFKDYRPSLGPGERGVLMIIATDRKQARVIMRYILALIEQVPMLKHMVVRQDSESLDLDNMVSIEITTASYRTIRGYTVISALCDEISFWRSEDSVNPAEEILAALRPAMSTIPGALLIGLGTPYKRSGPLYAAWKRHYGQTESPVLVVQADTRTMNPSVPQSVIDRATELDPLAASAEYLAQFRGDVGTFLDADVIERAIEPNRRERAPVKNISYTAFCDPSGGAHDSFTLAIGHQGGKRSVLDVCRGIKPPFSPENVVKEYAALLKSYRCSSVVGDRYSGEWVREAFSKEGIHYRHSELTKSECYLESLPVFSQGVVDLVDVPALTTELMQLERRTSRSGRDTVDHPPNGRDDLANSACGCLALLASRQAQGEAFMVNFLTGVPIEREDDVLRRKEARLRGVPVESIT